MRDALQHESPNPREMSPSALLYTPPRDKPKHRSSFSQTSSLSHLHERKQSNPCLTSNDIFYKPYIGHSPSQSSNPFRTAYSELTQYAPKVSPNPSGVPNHFGKKLSIKGMRVDGKYNRGTSANMKNYSSISFGDNDQIRMIYK